MAATGGWVPASSCAWMMHRLGVTMAGRVRARRRGAGLRRKPEEEADEPPSSRPWARHEPPAAADEEVVDTRSDTWLFFFLWNARLRRMSKKAALSRVKVLDFGSGGAGGVDHIVATNRTLRRYSKIGGSHVQ